MYGGYSFLYLEEETVALIHLLLRDFVDVAVLASVASLGSL
jgi:hypothetical protein